MLNKHQTQVKRPGFSYDKFNNFLVENCSSVRYNKYKENCCKTVRQNCSLRSHQRLPYGCLCCLSNCEQLDKLEFDKGV